MTGAFLGIAAEEWIALLRCSIVNSAVAVAAMRMAHVRRPAAFLALMVLLGSISFLVPPGGAGTLWYFLGFVANYIVIPFLFWEGRPARRALCAALLALLALLTEAIDAIILVALGAPISRGVVSNSAKWLILAPQCALLVLGGSLVGRLLRGRFAKDELLHSPPQYFLPLLLQLVAALAASQLATSAGLGDPGFYIALGLLSTLLIAAGLATLFSMERYAASARGRKREQALARALDESLAQSREAVAACEKTARLRHDQRNHLQVLRGLVERGKLDAARSYAAELRRELS